jgi:hypothetical protein
MFTMRPQTLVLVVVILHSAGRRILTSHRPSNWTKYEGHELLCRIQKYRQTATGMPNLVGVRPVQPVARAVTKPNKHGAQNMCNSNSFRIGFITASSFDLLVLVVQTRSCHRLLSKQQKLSFASGCVVCVLTFTFVCRFHVRCHDRLFVEYFLSSRSLTSSVLKEITGNGQELFPLTS